MEFIQYTIETIAQDLKQYPVEAREEILHQELDRAVIYYSDQWKVIQEYQPQDFRCLLTGEQLTSPGQLAWSILMSEFLERFTEVLDQE